VWEAFIPIEEPALPGGQARMTLEPSKQCKQGFAMCIFDGTTRPRTYTTTRMVDWFIGSARAPKYHGI
jgi:hypothetical protein